MTIADWLVEILAWAALETWWQRNPSGPVDEPFPSIDVALHEFCAALPDDDLRWRVAEEHMRRRWTQ